MATLFINVKSQLTDSPIKLYAKFELYVLDEWCAYGRTGEITNLHSFSCILMHYQI